MANSTSHFGSHFFVDEKEVVQVMPIEYSVWHTGKGYDFGNTSTIAVEICRSMCDLETYLKAQKRAVKFIKDLMKQYNLTNDQVYFHSNFDNIYCPHRILDIYNDRKNFIEKEFD